MGEMVIRIADETLIERLSSSARNHDHSVESEAIRLLNEALAPSFIRDDLLKIADAIAAKTPQGVPQTSSVDLVREDRSR